MRHLLFLINPIAGTKNKTSLPEEIAGFCSKNNLSFRIEHTNREGEYTYLEEIIQTEKITDVIIAGGDGTINQVVGALRNSPVNFGIIPFGSGNGLAFSAGIPTDIQKALQIILSENALPTDAFTINNTFACMLSGIGFDAEVAHAFAQQKTRGLFTYTMETLKHFMAAKAYPFLITADGQSIETEAFFISIANSNQFGNQFTIAPKASLHDGLLDIVVVKKMNKLLLPFTVFSQVTGQNEMKRVEQLEDADHILYFQAKQLSIQNTGAAMLHIDGDPAATAGNFNIEILEKAFYLLVPAAAGAQEKA